MVHIRHKVQGERESVGAEFRTSLLVAKKPTKGGLQDSKRDRLRDILGRAVLHAKAKKEEEAQDSTNARKEAHRRASRKL